MGSLTQQLFSRMFGQESEGRSNIGSRNKAYQTETVMSSAHPLDLAQPIIG